MGFTLITSISQNGAAAATTTTSGVDTTASDLFVMVASFYAGSDIAASDSNGNTWVTVGYSSAGPNNRGTVIFYSVPTVVGAGNTFTASGTTPGAGIKVFAYSGVDTINPLDTFTTGYQSATGSVTVGPSTPLTANSLAITGGTQYQSTGNSIGGSFSTSTFVSGATGFGIGGGSSAIIQSGGPSAITANWSFSGGTGADPNGVLAIFRPFVPSVRSGNFFPIM